MCNGVLRNYIVQVDFSLSLGKINGLDNFEVREFLLWKSFSVLCFLMECKFILDILTFDFEVGFLMNHEVDLINLFCVLSENFVFLGEFGVKKFAYLGIFVFWKVRVENQVLGVICKENEYVEGGLVLEYLRGWKRYDVQIVG